MAFTPDGDRYRNDAVALDAAAIFRGGTGWVDPINMKMGMRPWVDGLPIVDEPTLRMILPDGCSYGGAISDVTLKGKQLGFRQDIGNGFYADAVDLQASKIPDQYTDLTDQGMKLLLWMPAAHVASLPVDGDGNVTIKRLEIGGTGVTQWGPQGALSQEDIDGGAFRPDWMVGGIVGYGDEVKRNVVLGAGGQVLRPWMTGKQFNLPRPSIVAWSGTIAKPSIMGVFYGELKQVGGEIHKLADVIELQAWANAGATLFSTDATLGYTALGATNGDPVFDGRAAGNEQWTAIENGTVNKITFGFAANFGAQSDPSIYVGSGAPTDPYLTNSEITATGTNGDPVTNMATWSYPGGSEPTITNGQTYVFVYRASGGTQTQVYDSASGFEQTLFVAWSSSPPPSTYGTPNVTRTSRKGTAYITYTPSGAVGGYTERGTARGVRRGVERGI